MERLMVELLELLAAADISGPQQAAAVLQLTGERTSALSTCVALRDHSSTLQPSARHSYQSHMIRPATFEKCSRLQHLHQHMCLVIMLLARQRRCR
jgi:hypothetical protein